MTAAKPDHETRDPIRCQTVLEIIRAYNAAALVWDREAGEQILRDYDAHPLGCAACKKWARKQAKADAA